MVFKHKEQSFPLSGNVNEAFKMTCVVLIGRIKASPTFGWIFATLREAVEYSSPQQQKLFCSSVLYFHLMTFVLFWEGKIDNLHHIGFLLSRREQNSFIYSILLTEWVISFILAIWQIHVTKELKNIKYCDTDVSMLNLHSWYFSLHDLFLSSPQNSLWFLWSSRVNHIFIQDHWSILVITSHLSKHNLTLKLESYENRSGVPFFGICSFWSLLVLTEAGTGNNKTRKMKNWLNYFRYLKRECGIQLNFLVSCSKISCVIQISFPASTVYTGVGVRGISVSREFNSACIEYTLTKITVSLKRKWGSLLWFVKGSVNQWRWYACWYALSILRR